MDKNKILFRARPGDLPDVRRLFRGFFKTAGGEKFALALLTLNLGLIVLTPLGLLLGGDAPFSFVQILWFELLLAPFAMFVFTMGHDADAPAWYRAKPGKGWRYLLGQLLLTVLLYTGTFFETRHWGTKTANALIFHGFLFFQVWNIMNLKGFCGFRSVLRDLPDDPYFLIGSGVLLAAQLSVDRWFGTVFHTAPLSFADWLMTLGLTSLPLWCGEIRRAYAFYGQTHSKEICHGK